MPSFAASLDRALADAPGVSVIYPVGDPAFVHVWKEAETTHYHVIEPALDEAGAAVYRAVREKVLHLAPLEQPPRTREELVEVLERLLARAVVASDRGGGLLQSRVAVPPALLPTVRYVLFRNVVGHGPLQPLLDDPYLEDVHAIGTHELYCIHKVFGTCATNVRFPSAEELDEYLKNLSERVGRPVSQSTPIVDATLDDGSRINIVYSTDVSRRGPSFTVRRFSDTPLSITQLIKFGALSPGLAAYLWLCLENGQSVFVCGETASGKTSTLNALLTFVPHHQKVFTAEDTPEVLPPHRIWQQLLTRERGPQEGRVEMYTLLKAALRSRPNLIVVGEIRGAEGNVAFQAMQTGHACMATFHASSVGKMIQRLSSEPINVPPTFLDNLNVALIQMAVYRKGKLLRRVLAVEEIEGFSKHTGGVETRRVFDWDPKDDHHEFRGLNNSYILEAKVAEKLGYADKRAIYQDMRVRQRILEELVRRGVFDYREVNRLIGAFQVHGPRGLPFPLEVAA